MALLKNTSKRIKSKQFLRKLIQTHVPVKSSGCGNVLSVERQPA